ncbi:MAG: phosphatase PAP2 family protein [Flavobacteriaceae bacterium]|nr:phosphatase PAP2 family protein [Flavobacteriaceae bacterium]|tara:strand:+ start:1752 stop:2321 length:570 start_codon:yes stop_codon:yes gene_type:complete
MIDDIIIYDKTLFVYLNNLGSNEFDFIWIILSNKLINIFLYAGIVFLFFKNSNIKSATKLVLFILLMILFTDQTTNLVKDSFSRLRPCHDPFLSDITRLVKDSCGGLYGYFSAHASNSFALAIFFNGILKNRSKYLGVFFIIVAFLVGYSRIYLGVHYPLDVVSGAFYGIFSGYIFYVFWKRIKVDIKN